MFEFYNNILAIHATFLYNKSSFDGIVKAKKNLSHAN
jgi:hypothetical protein